MDTFDASNQRRSVKPFDPSHRFTAAGDQAQVTDASLLIVLTADLKAWKKSPERYWRNASPEIRKLAVGWMAPFYEGKEQRQPTVRVNVLSSECQSGVPPPLT